MLRISLTFFEIQFMIRILSIAVWKFIFLQAVMFMSTRSGMFKGG